MKKRILRFLFVLLLVIPLIEISCQQKNYKFVTSSIGSYTYGIRQIYFIYHLIYFFEYQKI